MKESIAFRLNGQEVGLEAAPDAPLVELLRENFGLMGAKIGCSIGRCGACTVLVDGRAVNSCLLRAYRLGGTEIITAEGITLLLAGRAVSQALAEEVAFQCGYCAPGMTVALTALLQQDTEADETSVRDALAGNLCRCSGYHSILRAAATAVRLLRSETESPP